MTPAMEYAMCECGERMNPAGECGITHRKLMSGKVVERLAENLCGEDLEGRNCHDCGTRPGAVHHVGCDNEPCCVCGGQSFCCSC